MPQQITLACNAEITIAHPNLVVKHQGDELRFSYGGLSNDPLGNRYPLMSFAYHIEPQAMLYGDGFQMSCQTIGHLTQLKTVGNHADNGSLYRIYSSSDPQRFYNYLVIGDSLGYTLVGFTSCHRFCGYFELSERQGVHTITAYIDGENTHPQTWSNVALESVVVLKSATLPEIFQRFSHYIQSHHPTRALVKQSSPLAWLVHTTHPENGKVDIPIAQQVLRQQQLFPQFDTTMLSLEWQHLLHDWLLAPQQCQQRLAELIKPIVAQGNKAALRIEVFTAPQDSPLCQTHRQWLLANEHGEPLRSDQVTCCGRDRTARYIFDITHIDVQERLFELIKFLSVELGVTLLQLSGSYWGASRGARKDVGVTSIEAYRIALKIIGRAAGQAMIGVSHGPLWPSLGLVDVMRVADNACRDERQFASNAQATLLRSWQHQALWHLDPDYAVLTSLANQGCDKEVYDFHRTALLASSGLLVGGDPLDDITPFAKKSLQRLATRQRHNLKPNQFSSLNLCHSTLELTAYNDLHCLFNYHQPAQEVMLTANHCVDWYDFWTSEKLNSAPTQIFAVSLPSGLSARAILTVS